MMSKRTTAVLIFAVAGLGACSSGPRHRFETPSAPLPPPAAMEPHAYVTAPSIALPKGCADQACARKVENSHHQYYDQRRKRYYFYDPARRAYFWEDGSPKG